MAAVGGRQDRYLLQQRALDDDGARGGPWQTVFEAYGQTTFLRAGEAVQQARMQGQQPVLITVWANSASRRVDNTYQAVDARDASRVFNVTAANLSDDRLSVEILAVRKIGKTGTQP